jgi:phage baseplate assembly protein W
MKAQSATVSRAFLGVGWAFPVAHDKGDAAMAQGEEDIAQAIRVILGTNPGERVMRPEFGAGLKQFVFEPASTATLELIRQRVEESLIDFEPRIEVLSVKVTTRDSGGQQVLIDVSYRVRATNTKHNLVYPFYLDEGPAR